MADNDELIVQKQATRSDVIKDHIAGMGGYAIAEKYGLDTEKVKEILQQADAEGKFIPGGLGGDADSNFEDNKIVEGVNPPAKVETTDTKTTTKNQP